MRSRDGPAAASPCQMHAWCLPSGIRKRTGKFYHGVAYVINTDLKRHSACSACSVQSKSWGCQDRRFSEPREPQTVSHEQDVSCAAHGRRTGGLRSNRQERETQVGETAEGGDLAQGGPDGPGWKDEKIRRSARPWAVAFGPWRMCGENSSRKALKPPWCARSGRCLPRRSCSTQRPRRN
jgi:hypothetical protein